MRIKSCDLIGDHLDWAVAKVEGKEVTYVRPFRYWVRDPYYGDDDFAIPKYSTDPARAYPIIYREGISTIHGAANWWAETDHYAKRYAGPTPLIAAMRCYVTSKLGDEIDIPDELA